jgi:hypothetical protein
MRPRIFVALAAYRDPECQWTLRDLFARARHPERISAGLCWQVVPEEDGHCFLVETRPAQVRVESFDARTTKGLCWARSVAHGLWDGEEYVLQIDSHMRLHDGWDEALLETLQACPSPRPVLSTYPAAYLPPDRLEPCETSRLYLAGHDRHGLPRIRAALGSFAAPVPVAVLAGGFIFAPAALFREVPYDEDLGFQNEEIAFSACVFTHGWDAFAPHRCLLHHYYERKGAARHWDDAPHAEGMEALSLRRIQHLLGVVPGDDPRILARLDGPRGLGAARPLAEFFVAARPPPGVEE